MNACSTSRSKYVSTNFASLKTYQQGCVKKLSAAGQCCPDIAAVQKWFNLREIRKVRA